MTYYAYHSRTPQHFRIGLDYGNDPKTPFYISGMHPRVSGHQFDAGFQKLIDAHGMREEVELDSEHSCVYIYCHTVDALRWAWGQVAMIETELDKPTFDGVVAGIIAETFPGERV